MARAGSLRFPKTSPRRRGGRPLPVALEWDCRNGELTAHSVKLLNPHTAMCGPPAVAPSSRTRGEYPLTPAPSVVVMSARYGAKQVADARADRQFGTTQAGAEARL